MLPTRGRYEYSNITMRPGGRRLAVYVALNVEAFGFGVGKGVAIAPPDQAQSHSIYSWRDYGNRVGIWRLFDLLDELGIPAQAQMNLEISPLPPSGSAVAGASEDLDVTPDAIGPRSSRAADTCDVPRDRARIRRIASLGPSGTPPRQRALEYWAEPEWTVADRRLVALSTQPKMLNVPELIGVGDPRLTQTRREPTRAWI
jgi:hypothetical protein